MNKLILPCLLGVLIAVYPGSSKAQLNVTTGQTPTQLVQSILGTGVTPYNIVLTGSGSAAGIFTCAGACNLGMGNGIILSSGNATGVGGPASTFVSAGLGTPGSPLLNPIATGQTYDAITLEFDFCVATDNVSFQYVFASEEYNEWVNTQFNDVFAFFLSGPCFPETNIALIPGTGIPVAINNVNNGNSGGASTGPCNNCGYFVDNVGGGSVVFDAFTTVLTATASVIPGETYHIKLVIADVGDGIYDSAVFLKANSFSSLGPVPVLQDTVPLSANDTVWICPGGSVNLCAPNCADALLSPNWSTGATTQCITVSTPGYYSYFKFNPNGSCFSYSYQVILAEDDPQLVIVGDTTTCPGGTTPLSMNLVYPNGDTVAASSYSWNTGETTQVINATPGTYSGTAITPNANCTISAPPHTVQNIGPPPVVISGPTALCQGNSTTLSANNGDSYLWSDGSTTQSIQVSNTGTYTVTVTYSGGCTSSGSVNVTASSNPTPVITGNLGLCQGSSTTLNAGPGFSTYQWSTSGTGQTITVNTTGNYSVTVTDVNGCTGSASVTVNVGTLPTPSITGNTTVCQGSTTTLNAGSGYTSYLWQPGGQISQTINTGPGNYSVIVTNASGCTGTASVNVTSSVPSANILAVGPTTFCAGQSVTLIANPGSSYQWSPGNQSSQSITVSQSGTYSVVVTNAAGCTATATPINVVVNPLPTPAITGLTTICDGETTTLDAGGGYSSYQWSNGPTSQTATTGLSGNYQVTVTDANGCSATASTSVSVNTLPTPAITGDTDICQGETTTLDAGAGYVNYQWSGAGGSNQTITVNSANSYTVTVTDANGCTGSSSISVNVNPAPTPSISGSTNICQGATTILDAGSGYSSYSWSTADNTQTVTTGSSGSFTVTVTDANGCIGSASVNVTVNPLPTPSISGNTAICQGATTTLDAGPGYSSYQWNPTGNTQTINPTVAGTYVVTVTDANGCTASASVNLAVSLPPTPAITGDNDLCQGETTSLDAGAGYASYQWSNGAGTSQIATIGTSGNYTVTVTDANGCTGTASMSVTVNSLPVPAITGLTDICQGATTTLDAGAGYVSYQWSGNIFTQTMSTGTSGSYTVTVTDGNGCSASTSVNVTVNALPTPSISGNTSICQGTTTTFDAGAGYSSYQWTPSGSSQIVTAGTAGSYSVIVTDANGCTGSAGTTLTVNPLPTPAITGNNTLCQGETTTLDAGGGYANYQWSNGAGSSQTVTVGASANYIVTVTDANGCTATANMNVTVNPLPVPAITGNTILCQGETTILDAGANYVSYQWSTSDNSQTITTGSSGGFTVTVTDANGCIGSATVNVTVNPLPTPLISGNTVICQGSSTTFDAGSGYISYQWTPSGNTQTVNVGTAGNYSVIVTDANGCTASASTSLTVNTATANITAQGPTTFCQGDNVMLTANGGSNYLWSNNETTQSITVNTSGTYTVTVTATNGCTAISTPVATTVSVPVATAIAQGSTTLCPGDDVTITANSGSSYLWSTNETTQTINVSQAGSYSVTVTNSIGCVAVSNIVPVSVSQPTAAITALGPTTFCIGDDVELEANLGSSYLWSTGATTRKIVVSTPGNYSVTVTNIDNCTAVSAPEQVTVNTAVATITALGPTTLCPSDNVVLEANSGLSYLWSTGETTQTISVSSTGTYVVTVLNNNGCSEVSAPVSTTVSVPQAIITPSGPTTICPGNTVTLNANPGISYLWSTGETTQSIAASQAGNYTVEVTNNDGCDTISTSVEVIIDVPVAVATAQGPTNFCLGENVIISANNGSGYLWNTGETTQNITASSAGTYSVTVTNATGCTEVSNEIVVTTMTAVANITPLGPTIFCPGGEVTLEANPGLSYTWSNGETTQSITVNEGGAYTVIVLNNNGCDANSSPVQVTISPLPQISYTADRLGGCDPFTPQFINNTITDANATYFWDFGDGTTSSITNPSHQYVGVGVYTVTLQVTSSFGCFAEFTYPNMITVSASPIADFTYMNEKGGGTDPLQFNSTIRYIDQSIDAAHWIWDFGDGFTSNDQNPLHTYSEAGEYRIKLTVLNQYDCPATKEATVLVTPFFIPNAFTPDGDGKNDAFFNINFEMNVASFELQVFNRWGQMVFKSDDPAKAWRGEYSDGKPAAQGVYVYQYIITDHNNIEHEYRGQVTLVR